MRAWAARGIAAQMSGGRSGSASFIARGIQPRRSSRKPCLKAGLNAYGVGALRVPRTVGHEALGPTLEDMDLTNTRVETVCLLSPIVIGQQDRPLGRGE